MADQDKAKSKGGDKQKSAAKPDKAPKAEKSPKPDKAAKSEKAAEAPAEDSKKAPKAAPRAPADPRAKVWKKFQGRFLPRGPLRDRYAALHARWNADENHGGVTVDELKSLLTDWRASQAKRVKTPA